MATKVDQSVDVKPFPSVAFSPQKIQALQQPQDIPISVPDGPKVESAIPTVSRSKKKKKRKNGTSQQHGSPSQSTSPSSTPSMTSLDSPIANSEEVAIANCEEQWKHRVQSIRGELSKAQKENTFLQSELTAALARASDAETAESVVNKGLLTARSVIAQRDRSLGEVNSALTVLRAEAAQLREERRKLEKRLQLLKTMSINLQETREARDVAEKKVGEFNASNALLNKQLQSLVEQVEVMAIIKQQLSHAEAEVEALTREKADAQLRVKRITSATFLTSAGVLLGSLAVRSLTVKRSDD